MRKIEFLDNFFHFRSVKNFSLGCLWSELANYFGTVNEAYGFSIKEGVYKSGSLCSELCRCYQIHDLNVHLNIHIVKMKKLEYLSTGTLPGIEALLG